MGRVYEAYKRVNTTRRPEGSVELRIAILVAVEVAVLATLVSGAAPAVDALAALALLPVGAWVSHTRKDRDNTVVKLLLTVGATLALFRFFGDVRFVASVDDTRAPLAGLFLAVQVLHGFDLPARRDLGFTLASSLTLIALSATNTHAMVFGGLMMIYAVAAGASMVHIQRSAALERADKLRQKSGLAPLRAAGAPDPPPMRPGQEVPQTPIRALAAAGGGTLRAALPALLVGLLVFSILPRSNSTQFGGLPFKGFPSFNLPSPLVNNPGLNGGGNSREAPSGGALGFNPTAYFGFAEYVDLRTVGQLSEDPVMRVRADRPRFWRGIVFDRYDGTGWTRTAEQPDPTYGAPVRLVEPTEPDAQYTEVVQTYELLTDTPNLIFSAAEATEVYLSGGSVHRWDDGTITTSQLQSKETIYSVISIVDTSPPDVLRAADGDYPADLLAQYTEVPADLPQRVTDLATTLTAGLTTPYEKAEAIEDWIGANTEYTLNELPPPDGRDLVDHFIFESQRGWCEPIASSMTVMLRSIGVPARFATGFQPGSYNPISGVWDVKMSNAHAWVEVSIPGHGWVPFDPTGAVPEAVDNRVGPRVPLLSAISWVAGALVGLVPAPVRAAAKALVETVREDPLVATAVVLLLALILGLVWRWRRRGRRRDVVLPVTAFDHLVYLLDARGVPFDDWQTPREFVRRVRLHRPDLPEAALETILRAEEKRRYAPHLLPPSGVAEDVALANVADALTRDPALVG